MPEVPREGKEEDKTVQHILHNTQDKNNREMDKGMDSLELSLYIVVAATQWLVAGSDFRGRFS